MFNDIRFAWRMIASHRWFSAAVIVTLALGIGVNTTVFTLTNAVLMKPVPVPNGARLVMAGYQDVTRPANNNVVHVCYADFLEFRAHHRSFEGFEAMAFARAVISESNNPPDRFGMGRITPGLFDMLQTAPALGRGFTPEDSRPGAEPVLLISDGVWKTRYGGDRSVIGRLVRVNGMPATIVGVMPAGFKFPNLEEVWMPFVPTTDLENRSNRPLRIFGMLKPGVTVEEAGADLAVIAHRLAAEFPDTNKNFSAIVRTFQDTVPTNIRITFLTMMGAVAFVLLIACANVANLMLSRAIARQREISVRAALGASRLQLIRQLLVESVFLSVLGGALGLGLSMLGVHAFDVATRDVGKPYWIIFTMDYRAFGYFAALSVLSGLIFGFVPALRASRIDVNTALKDDSLSGGSHHGGRLAGALVMLQFSLTVVLLAGAGLMVRSVLAAQTTNTFVPRSNILTARVALPDGRGERYAAPTDRLRFYDELLPRLAALPGVTHASATSMLPGLGSGERQIEIEGRPVDTPANAPRVSTGVHSPAYLAVVDVPILAGRAFDDFDGAPGKEAAIVTNEFAAKHWPGESAIGKRFRFIVGNNERIWIPVVGVCGDIIQRGREIGAPPLVFTPLRQEPNVYMTLALRTSTEPTALASAVRSVVQGLDQDIPLHDVRSLTAALARSTWFLKIFGTLFLTFALIALLLASVGLYSVVAQATARRTREIGIRMALGATAARIMRLVLSRGLVQIGVGLVLGLAGAFFATRLLDQMGLLFRVSPRDPAVFAAITVLLVAIGVFACWLPARRAAALHPVHALRSE